MKSVVEEIVASLEEKAQHKLIEDLRIGLCYTAVILNDGNLGLAYTFPSRGKLHSSCDTLASGSLRGKNAREIIRYTLSDNLLASSVGIATINALVNQKIDTLIEGDILNTMKPSNTDIVGMVGFLGPLVDPLKKLVKKIYIFEKEKIINSPDIYPSEKIPEFLPHCSFIIMSATTLINKTIDSLLTLAQNAREIIIVGATTPLLANIFAKRGVTMLSGIQIVDNERVLQVVNEGGGMRAFKQAIKKVNVLLENN